MHENNNSKSEEKDKTPPQNEENEDKYLLQDTTLNRSSTLIAEFKRLKAGASDNVADNENQAKKIPFPMAIFFIIGTEFCERFNYYGMRTTLVMYLKNYLEYSDDTSTVIFHIFVMLAYSLCLVGAIISDSWLGKFRTILYISFAYVFGSVTTAIGAVPQFQGAAEVLTLTGLILIAAGSGGIKPCVSVFGGDQFKLPDQEKQLAWFFTIFYFSINAGALLSTLITPILRDKVSCFGEEECQSLAFGLPALLMILSLVIFIIGRPFYTIVPPSGNMLLLVSKAIFTAIITKCKERKKNRREHWLDFADKKYDQQLIADIKAFGRILIVFLPLPLFWALFEQQGSRWVLQADHMDGDMGLFQLSPDHMQIINPLLILIFLPLCQWAVYPALKYVGIKRPLQKMILGGMLAGVAFIFSAILELQLEKYYPVVPEAGKAQLRIFNGEPCDYTFQTNIPGKETVEIKAFDYFEFTDISVENDEFTFEYKIEPKSGECKKFDDDSKNMNEKTAYSLFMASNSPIEKLIWYEDYVERPKKGKPLARILTNVMEGRKIIWKAVGNNKIEREDSAYKNKLGQMRYGKYKIFVGETEVFEANLKLGGVYTFVIFEKSEKEYTVKVFEITKPNSVNMLWIIPQFVVITMAEVMLSVTALEFSYSQAPLSMKSIVTACFLLTVALGSAIVAIIAKLKMFESMAFEFFLYAALMIVDMLVFILIAYFYKPNNPI